MLWYTVSMTKPFTPPELRFWPKVNKTDSCWIWAGQIHKPTGYGLFWNGKKTVRAHRYRFITDNGYEPEVVMHTCDNPSCVNPAHLTGGSQLDNIRDRDAKRRHWAQTRTHCKRGHEITNENIYYHNGRKTCKPCRRLMDKERRNR